MGVGGIKFSGETRYEGVKFNDISDTREWGGPISRKKALHNTWMAPIQIFLTFY